MSDVAAKNSPTIYFFFLAGVSEIRTKWTRSVVPITVDRDIHVGGRGVSDSLDDVLAWQRVRLERNAVCDDCNVLLQTGSDAAIGSIAVPRGASTRPPIIYIPCHDRRSL